ncbi:MAG: hypothetical protein RLY86_3345 [Pseudomonadota bacterium]|jgi:adenylate cyclase
MSLPSPVPSDLLRRFTDWVTEACRARMDMEALFREAAHRLADLYHLDRISLNLEVIHPELGGHGYYWHRDKGLYQNQAPRGLETSDDYLSSPVRIVDETGQPFRIRREEGHRDLGVIRTLWAEGFTDYWIVPLPFLDEHRTAAMSFATRRPDGFGPEHLHDLEAAAASLSPLAEARAVRSMATDLLSVYLGREPGKRVFNGQILRGDSSSIFAAILFADLRGFTAFTQANTSAVVIERLNTWFGHAVQAVEEAGGEVLKFMGDGMMAIFPAQELNPAEACGHALAAAAAMQAAVDGWNATRPSVCPPLAYGLSLHLGYVAFGNIGGARRLDFTVVGPAVNQASRMLDIAKQLDRQVVVSQAFAGCSARPFDLLGTFELRSLPKPEKIYAPRD